MTLLQTQQDLGRAKNVLQDFLVRKLLIPKVYLDARLNGEQVDVLAIDRSGVGDVHAVRVFSLDSGAESGASIRAAFILLASPSLSPVEGFKSVPSHFRYIALVGDDPNARKINFANEIMPPLYAEDGVGRVGILYVNPSEYDPSVQIVTKAERFRSSKEIVDLADQYVAEHTANWEVRDE
jgi:hypothetical protein